MNLCGLHCAGGMHMYFLKNGLDFALDFITLAMGLLICLIASTPSLAAGNTPITISYINLYYKISAQKTRSKPGLAIDEHSCFF